MHVCICVCVERERAREKERERSWKEPVPTSRGVRDQPVPPSHWLIHMNKSRTPSHT